MAGPEGQLEVRILGPLEAVSGGVSVALGGRKQRTVLALLATRLGSSIAIDALIDALWPEGPPVTATTTVQVYVSRLRKLVGAVAIVSEAGGYRLDVGDDAIDAARFERLAAAGREHRASGRTAEAATALAEALSLWRGAALADFAYDSWAQTAINRLEELRLATLEERIDVDLELGRHSELIADVETLVGEHPLRERLRGQLMLTLYRTGRQAEALETYQSYRRTLDEELGIKPSAELKELERRILQQDHELTPATPVKSLNQTSLPVPRSPLVGREREVREVIQFLEGSPLLTLTGTGGSGKTRLAIAAAAELVADYPDGVWFVSLAELGDPDLVEAAIASTLGVRLPLAEFVSTRRLLLVLDNLEHLLPEAARVVLDLLAGPDVRILATSRERLALTAEQEYPVPTLSIEAAVELFDQRARRLKPAFELDEHVAAIASGLNGLPLAIELAAARVKVLTPSQIRERLGKSLELLTSGVRDAPTRQRTLRATMEWSYELLTDRERRIFPRLGVFAGSFDVAGATSIAEADIDVLQALVDKNLVHASDGGRFVLLETIREFAFEQLGSDESSATEIRDRHADHFLTLAERVEAESRSGDTPDPYHELDADLGNLRAAIVWAREARRSDILMQYAAALWRFWCARGYVAEGRAVMDEALASVRDPSAQALLGRCALRMLAGAGAGALMADAEVALAVCEESGDDFSRAQAWNLMARLRGVVLAQLGAAERASQEAFLFAERGNFKSEKAESIWGLTLAALSGPMTVPAAIARVDQLLALAADEQETRAFCLSARGALEAMAGNFELGRAQLAEGTATFEQLGLNVFAANNAQLSFVVEMLAGDPDAAASALRASFDRLSEMGEQGFLSTIAAYLAHVLYDLREDAEAERLSRVSEEKAAPDDVFSQILWRGALAKVLARRFELDRAYALASEAAELAEGTDLLNMQGDTLLDLAHVLSLADRRAEASAAIAEAVRRFAAKGNTAAVARATKAAAEIPALVD